MNSWTLGYPGDQLTLWGVNVLLQTTLAAAIALTISFGLRRAAALRYAVLLSGLTLILLSPLAVGVMQWSGRGWISLSTKDASEIAMSTLSDAAELTTAGSAAAASEKLDASRRFEGGLMKNGRELSGGGPVSFASGRHMGQHAVADNSASFQYAKAPVDSLATSSNSPPKAVWLEAAIRTVVPPLLLVWLAVATMLLAKLAAGCLRLNRILRLSAPIADAAIQESFAEAARALQLRRLPELVLSERLLTPCSTGAMRPRIVLSESLISRVTSQQLRDIFVHELAHVIRRDQAILLLQNIAGALFWLHPLVRALIAKLAQAREEVCDNYVLGATDAPAYSRTLLTLARLTQTGSPLPAAVGLFVSRWKLEDRVAGLLDERRSRTTRLTWRNWTFVGAIAVALGAVTALGTISLAMEDNDAGEQPFRNASATAPVAPTDSRAANKSTEALPDDGLLMLNLTVLMPDGSPAAGAIVQSLHGSSGPDQTARADNRGRVMIRDAFGNGCQIHARSPDGRFQATFRETAMEARTALAKPRELTLAPASDHRLTITSEGKPAGKVHVVAYGHFFRIRGETDPKGVAVLHVPAGDTIHGLVAWHPDLGIAGVRDLQKNSWPEASELLLSAPAPLTIRAVDPRGRPVPALELAFSMKIGEGDWILSSYLPAARARTDEKGEAQIAWAPGEKLQYVDVDVLGSAWKIDETDIKQLSRRIVTIHVRRQKPVEGRLVMPEGRSAEGILITGFAFGPGHEGDVPQIRARRDGTFVFDAPSEHAYVLGLSDREWAADPWTGVVLSSNSAEPAQIAIPVVPAVPVTVEVTRGSQRQPLAGAWVELDQRRRFQWTDADGEERHASGSVGGWLRTDAQGCARGGVARGKIEVRVSDGQWDETREIEVTSDAPVDVKFHRPWSGNRHVVARMTLAGVAFQPSTNSTALCWTKRGPGFVALTHQPVIRDDSTITVDFDQEVMELLAIDREQKLSGFVKVGLDDETVELMMERTAAYSGTVLDEEGKPMVGWTMKLTTDSSFQDVVEQQRTDDAGRFRFTGVAVNTPLRLWIEPKEGLKKYFLFDTDRFFEPGEVREGGPVRPERMGDDGRSVRLKKPSPPRPLAERLRETCENVRVTGMHALVVLQGDGSADVTNLANRITDPETDSALAYLSIVVNAEQLQTEAAIVADHHWNQPKAGEVVLIALDGHQKPLAMETIGVADSLSARSRAESFLADHRPTFEDAREKLNRARKEASRDGKRVWLIVGGPRCGPCFRLGRWIDRQRDMLEKDYVIVKVMENLQDHADEVGSEIGGANQGIPWFVITEPDGKILMTSKGPTGNMGMPSSTEDLRHFRKMLEQTAQRLSGKEIGELIESLKPPR